VSDTIVYDVFAALLAAVVVWQMRRRLILRSRGLEITARCFDRQWRGRGGPQYLLSYTTPDGVTRTHTAGGSDVPPGTREGDSVTVLFDPASPQRVETALISRRPLWRHYDMMGVTGLALGILLVTHVL
jgi:hypothetical protein